MYSAKRGVFTAYNGAIIPMMYREDTNDFNTIVSILTNDEYHSKDIACKEGDVFVDIGAHIGAWSALMRNLVNGKLGIIAVEPLPENIAILPENILGRVVPRAISNRTGTKMKIYYADNSEFGLHHKFIGNTVSDHVGSEFVEVETISLNDLLKDIPHCRAVKIDAEGAEHKVFPFTSKETWNKIDYIVGEYHNPAQDPKKTRGSLLKYTRGIFEDISEDKNEERLGNFMFRRYGIQR